MNYHNYKHAFVFYLLKLGLLALMGFQLFPSPLGAAIACWTFTPAILVPLFERPSRDQKRMIGLLLVICLVADFSALYLYLNSPHWPIGEE